jgi:Phage Mu protein F like protein
MMRKRSNEKILRPVHPNAGLAAVYRKRLTDLITEMDESVRYWISAAYRANPPELAQDGVKLAHDDISSTFLRDSIRRLIRRWRKKFDKLAPKLARYFALSSSKRSDAKLKKMLSEHGIAVEWTMTRAMRDVLNATVNENVALIRSIPERYLSSVETLVMTAVATGRDLGPLSRELQNQFGVTKRRAAFIARDQVAKANAVLTRVRQQEIGITTAIWLHSKGGRVPRKTHLAMNGKRYNVAEGMYDPDPKVQRNIWPGELINCFPGDMPVSSLSRIERLWRTPFNGPMIHIGVGSDLLKGTPNHPIFTARGLLSLDEVERGDKVVCMSSQDRNVIDDDKDQSVTFSDLFEAASVVFGNVSREAFGFNFYGDVPYDDVDEISVDLDLLLRLKTFFRKQGNQFSFAKPNCRVSFARFGISDEIIGSFGPRFFDKLFFLLGTEFVHSDKVGLTAVPYGNAAAYQDATNVACTIAGDLKFFGDGHGAKARGIECFDFISQSDPIHLGFYGETLSTKSSTQVIGIAANRNRGILEQRSVGYELRRVTEKFVRNHSGHVFTMQTGNGYYSVGSAFVQAKNCRCVARSVVPGFT